jgi:integrase
MAHAGNPPHVIATMLGHRDAGFTLRTYVHTLPEGQVAAAAALDAALRRSASGAE